MDKNSTIEIIEIQKYWNYAKKCGYDIRKSGKDGRQGWHNLANEFKVISNNSKSFTLNKKIKELIQLTYVNDELSEDQINSAVKINEKVYIQNCIEKYHFIVQHMRIPFIVFKTTGSYNLPFIKLMQIAYNCGQYKALEEANEYDPEIVNFYNTNKLDQLSTFIN
jgi:hypothetical protein